MAQAGLKSEQTYIDYTLELLLTPLPYRSCHLPLLRPRPLFPPRHLILRSLVELATSIHW